MSGTQNTNPGNFANRSYFPSLDSSGKPLTLTNTSECPVPRRKCVKLLPRVVMPVTVVASQAWTQISRFVDIGAYPFDDQMH